MNGFVNVLKPVGATASDIVVCLRHVLKEKRVGHLGTLDPGASGVLPVAVGQGTKLFDYLTAKTKFYRAFFTFGKTTDTLDSYGSLTAQCDCVPTPEQLQSVLCDFVGKQQQIPPAYSAISVDGVRAYKLARSGAEVSLQAREIEIYECMLVRRMSADTYVIDIKCSGGTYIRSLARDIAIACNTVGYMSALVRLQSGCFYIGNAHTLDEIRNSSMPTEYVLPVDYPLVDVPSLILDDKYAKDLANGKAIKCAHFNGYKKVYCNGAFWGLGEFNNGALKLRYYLKSDL